MPFDFPLLLFLTLLFFVSFPFTTSPNTPHFDYSADGVMRSIEDSLQRMGLDLKTLMREANGSTEDPS